MCILWSQKYKFSQQNVISNMIECKDNAENNIYHVISAAILKNTNLGFFLPLKYMS